MHEHIDVEFMSLATNRFVAYHDVHCHSFPRSAQPPEPAWVFRQVLELAAWDADWAAVVQGSEE